MIFIRRHVSSIATLGINHQTYHKPCIQTIKHLPPQIPPDPHTCTSMENHAAKALWDPPPSYQASQSSPPCTHEIARGNDAEPPPYHNWQDTVPDTATFPPPPVTGFFCSNTGNASADDADRAHEYCDNLPLYKPVEPSAAVYRSVQEHDLRPVKPAEFTGDITLLSRGRWRGSTRDGNGDCLLSTNLPLYFALRDSPWRTETSKSIYFEVKILRFRAGPGMDDSSGLSIGFLAHPYPYWRSPGWERGSVGVFSDDGCRFVNDSWGGVEFTRPFRVGETVGLGMTFELSDSVRLGKPSEQKNPNVNLFFTRDGQVTGGWDLHEEVDEEAGGVEGLEGDFDIYGAIGLFGGVDFEVCFNPTACLWKPK